MRFKDFDAAGVALRLLRIVLFYALLLGIWQAVYDLHIWSPYLLPNPQEVWQSLKHYIDNGLIWDATKASMKRLLIGYAISCLLGLIVGMACGSNKYVDETLGSLVLGMQSLPSICWLPIAVLWFGIGEKAIIFVVAMGSIFAIAISARAGIQGIPALYRRAAATMGANKFQLIFWVLLPAMVPAMAHGLKLGWSFAWRSLMSGELLVAGVGLGGLLNIGRDLNDMSLVFAIMGVIIVLGVATDRVFFARMESWVQERWGLQLAT